jgi:hypothetical protein
MKRKLACGLTIGLIATFVVARQQERCTIDPAPDWLSRWENSGRQPRSRKHTLDVSEAFAVIEKPGDRKDNDQKRRN